MPTRSLSLLVQGDPKSGKSTLAATSPKPLLYLDIEGGTRFLDIRSVDWDPMKYAPPVNDGTWDTAVVKVRQYDDVIKAYEWLKAGKHEFQSVAIDSISELQQRLVDKVTNRDQAKLQDWGDILRKFMGFLRDMRDLTEHPTRPLQSIVLISMSVTDNNGKKQPFAQGQSKVMMPYLFDILGAMHVDTWVDDAQTHHEVYRLLIGPNKIYATGERVGGRVGSYIDNPTIPGLLDAVFGPLPTEE
ncbi:RecA-like DNA recombinase [Gordonia phage Sixama]|uniref:RecA-like DNA recombinase n=1 Tax=Gordonia phage Sixama TaxID=2653271 RepID=A0A5Q2F769_9CAUD|nr:RecA-like DNA recombinase [Gordonia phage Sixama]QGF20315.1 RecA-like DNA recombinase [Gordonia phage Sixama]